MKPLVQLLLWLCLGIIACFIAFLVLITKIDYSSDIPVEKEFPDKPAFDLYSCLKKTHHTNLKESFPYSTYLDSANWLHANSLLKDLMAMDTVNKGNEMLNQEVLSIALTEKLEERIKSKFENYNPDSLIKIMQWAEKFDAYSEIDEAHAVLFQVIYSYWFNFVSNTLHDYYDKDVSIKYNYKFKYISERLREKQFSTPVKGTYFEKTINKLIEKNWTYLFNKFWHATTIYYKLVVLFLFILVIFPYFYILKNIKNK